MQEEEKQKKNIEKGEQKQNQNKNKDKNNNITNTQTIQNDTETDTKQWCTKWVRVIIIINKQHKVLLTTWLNCLRTESSLLLFQLYLITLNVFWMKVRTIQHIFFFFFSLFFRSPRTHPTHWEHRDCSPSNSQCWLCFYEDCHIHLTVIHWNAAADIACCVASVKSTNWPLAECSIIGFSIKYFQQSIISLNWTRRLGLSWHDFYVISGFVLVRMKPSQMANGIFSPQCRFLVRFAMQTRRQNEIASYLGLICSAMAFVLFSHNSSQWFCNRIHVLLHFHWMTHEHILRFAKFVVMQMMNVECLFILFIISRRRHIRNGWLTFDLVFAWASHKRNRHVSCWQCDDYYRSSADVCAHSRIMHRVSFRICNYYTNVLGPAIPFRG